MLAIASQIILCLVLAALLGLIIGYLLGRSNCPKDTYKTGVIHDPHTADDGDCGDAEETDESGETSTADASDDADTEVNAEPQGLVQSANEASEEVETTAEDSTDSEATPAATDEAASAPADTEADKGTAVEDVEAESASAGSEVAAAGDETTASEEKEPEVPSDDDKPATLLDAPRNGKKDNLTRIKGIGVKIDALLNSIGVYHFDQIAAWTEKEANWIDHQLAFPGRSKRDDWVGQAKLLAEGKETEFSKRVDAGEVATSKKS